MIHHYYSDFFVKLKKIEDMRNPNYITYDSSILLLMRILANCCHLESRNSANQAFNCECVIDNMLYIFDNGEEELPHGDTINNFLKRSKIEDYENVIFEMVDDLIRKRVLEGCRIREQYYQIVLDGTQLFSTKKPRVEGALVHHHQDGQTTYHTQVLTAYLCAGNVVIPFGFEWLENEKEDISKQDCETNAAKRLLAKIKKKFPRLPICLSGDALYFSDEIISTCEKNNWKYMITVKEGRAPAFYKEYEELKRYSSTLNEYKTEVNGEKKNIRTYEYVNAIEYMKNKINVMELREDKQIFIYATNLLLSDQNIKETVAKGRNRWKIENKGFNDEKNHGYGLTHAYSYHANAIKGYYAIMLISHLLMQLLEVYKKSVGQPKGIQQLGQLILEALRNTLLSAKDTAEIKVRFQVRLPMLC